MKNNLFFAFATTLILSSFTIPTTTNASGIISPIPSVKNDGTVDNGIETAVNFIHIDDSAAIPDQASSRNATYKISLSVSEKYALSALRIALPEEVSVGSVEVTDRSGKPIAATTSMNGKKIAIAFNSPINSGSYLKVSLKDISTKWSNDNIWLLPVSAKLEGIADEIPLSLARIQTYSN